MIVWNNKMRRLRGGITFSGLRTASLKPINELLKLSFLGPLLGHVIQQMEEKLEGSPLKLFLYSGHDYTVVYLGAALKLWKDFFPDYCSAFIVKLHSNAANEYFVKVNCSDAEKML